MASFKASKDMKKLTNDQLAFVLARITIGLNLLIHGVVRIPKLSKFVAHITEGFRDTYLPHFIVLPFAYILPFIELILGLLLLIGLKTRWATAAGALLIAILIFGTSLQEDWALVGSQMIYAIFFFIMIKNLEHNAFAIDGKPRTHIHGFSTKK